MKKLARLESREGETGRQRAGQVGGRQVLRSPATGPSGRLLAPALSLCSLSGRKGQTLIHLAAKRGRTAAGRPLRHREKSLRKGSERLILTEKMRQSRPRGHPCLHFGCGPVGTSCLEC